MRLPVNNANLLLSYFAPFPSYRGVLVNLSLLTGCISLTPQLRNLGPRKLKTSFYRVMRNMAYLDILNRYAYTDVQTYRQTDATERHTMPHRRLVNFTVNSFYTMSRKSSHP